MLPRVVELAEGSAERQVKVAACELLHALVMVLLANSHPRDETAGALPNVGLYRHVLPALFRLAVDVDLVTRQLFAPLANQIIHLFTRTDSADQVYYQVILDACLVGVQDVYVRRACRVQPRERGPGLAHVAWRVRGAQQCRGGGGRRRARWWNAHVACCAGCTRS